MRWEVRKVEVSSMASPYLSPYEDPAAHARISALIRRHSSNREDVRAAMLGSVDLGYAQEVLDLGCGFGFWTEEIADRVARTACFTGIDACNGNEHSYLRSVESTGRQACFIHTDLDAHLPFEDASFDLVIAAYSLYFFVRIVPEVARVLRPGGRFLAVTHSEGCFAGLLSAVGICSGDSPLVGLIRRFSAENGESLLVRSFQKVERVDYLNSLNFHEKDRDDFLAYLRFKLPLLSPGAQYARGLPEDVVRRACESLRSRGRVTVQKDDALFVCGGPNGP